MQRDEAESPRGEGGVSHAPRRMAMWWGGNKGWVMVLISELFGACMSAAVQVLVDRDSSNAMHPMQVVWVRMTISFILSSLYMWTKKTPDFPFGAKGVRRLLVVRGFAGFFGISTFWYSLLYLDLAEATILSFITPLFVTVVSAKIFGTSLPWKVITAGLVSFIGVLVIAKPASLLRAPDDPGNKTQTSALLRVIAVCSGLLSVFGATTAYTIIKVIGHRTHALISVNYYAFTSSVGSAIFLLVVPGIGFKLPQGWNQWLLIVWIGISGFLLQFLLTMGLQHDKSSIAISMMYSQVLFVLILDRLIWGKLPDGSGLVGGLLVLVSTIYVTIYGGSGEGAAREGPLDEEEGLLSRTDALGEDATMDQGQDEGPLAENLVNE